MKTMEQDGKIELELYRYYRVRIKYHRTDDLQADAIPNGSTVIAQTAWIADKDEKFAGEFILFPAPHGPWFPERDAEILEQVSHQDYLNAMTPPF